MAGFLPQAIESVLAQDVEGLDYIVRDGASKDGTAEILDRYRGRLRAISEPDYGAADALRRGFAEGKGDIFGWLNADDILLPGTLRTVLQLFDDNPGVDVVYGGASWITEDARRIKPYPVVPNAAELLWRECLICQPACFFRKRAYTDARGIDVELRSAFDYDLWIRLADRGKFLYCPEEWALSRMYATNRSLSERALAFEEGIEILRRYYNYVPFQWVYSRKVYAMDGRDQFFEELQPSTKAYLTSLPAGLSLNLHKPLRYLVDWASHFTLRGLRRQIGARA